MQGKWKFHAKENEPGFFTSKSSYVRFWSKCLFDFTQQESFGVWFKLEDSMDHERQRKSWKTKKIMKNRENLQRQRKCGVSSSSYRSILNE